MMALRTLPAHPAQCKSTLSTMGCGPAGAAAASFFLSPPPPAVASLAAFFSSPMVVDWWGTSGVKPCPWRRWLPRALPRGVRGCRMRGVLGTDGEGVEWPPGGGGVK